jgi:DNA-binding CsgD family transcriptional regulator
LKLIPRAKILAALSVDNPVIEAKSWFYSNASSYYAPFVQSNGSSEFLVQAAERAEEIIEASDLRTPIDVRVLFDSNNPRAKAEWSLLSEYAAQTGFNLIDVSAKDPRTVFSTGEFDAYITTVRLASEVGGDPYWFTGNSVGQFENAKIDALLAKYAAETKPLNQISVLKDIDAELYAAKFALERLENIRSVLDKSSPLMIRHIWQGYQVYSWVIPLTLDDDTAEALDSKRATQRRVLVISRRVGTEDKPFDLVAGPIEKIDAEVIQLGPLDVLSPRELEVLALLGQGLSAAEIAAVLNRSVKTINTHRENIGKKLKIDDRVKLAMIAQRAGLQLADAEKERV